MTTRLASSRIAASRGPRRAAQAQFGPACTSVSTPEWPAGRRIAASERPQKPLATLDAVRRGRFDHLAVVDDPRTIGPASGYPADVLSLSGPPEID